MDTKVTTGGQQIFWEVGAIAEIVSGENRSCWGFHLRVKGRGSYLMLAFPDQKTAHKQQEALQKMIDESCAIVPMIVG